VKPFGKNMLFTPQITASPNSNHSVMTPGATRQNDSTSRWHQKTYPSDSQEEEIGDFWATKSGQLYEVARFR
jgi:hypothetical protein